MPESNSPLLSLHQLVPGYANNKLFEPLNLTLAKGQLVCLLGANGAGKSTLMRTIAGLQPALSGEIQAGNTGKKPDPAQVAVVLTDPVKVSNMTVLELITYGRYPYLNWNIRLLPHDEKIIDEAIAQVGIGDLLERNVDQLSDGQRQMVMIARALAQDTSVMLLDEPTSHLDLTNRLSVMRFLKNLARTTEKAILIATHELDLALQMTDVMWLAHQKTIIAGVPEDLILNGSLSTVFRIKGYDLNTGKVIPDFHRGIAVHLTGGTANEYQWTKKALERTGYHVDPSGKIIIAIESASAWRVTGETFSSIESLLAGIRNLS